MAPISLLPRVGGGGNSETDVVGSEGPVSKHEVSGVLWCPGGNHGAAAAAATAGVLGCAAGAVLAALFVRTRRNASRFSFPPPGRTSHTEIST